MNIPTRFSAVPALIQQFAESVANGATATHKDNARRTLSMIKEFIEWVLEKYPEPTVGTKPR